MKQTKKPFFAKFLENQIKTQDLKSTKGGRPDLIEEQTDKFPSDSDEIDFTHKYPSDGDDDFAS